MGKSTISMTMFNSFLYVYQRVIVLNNGCTNKNVWSKIEEGTTDGLVYFSYYPLVMTNTSPWKPWPIEIDGLPSYKMVIFHGELLVITRW